MNESKAPGRWFEQIGGPNAITLWSWLLTLPLGLVVGNVSTDIETDRSILVWSAILVAIHIFLGALMWLIWRVFLPGTPRKSRPVTAILVFVVLGLCRTVFLEVLDPIFGPEGTSLFTRLLTNVLGGAVVLALIALLVDDYRSHAEVTDKLRRVQASLQWLAEKEADTLRSADIDEITCVREQIEKQLRAGATGPENLRNISESIVRYRSHYLSEPAKFEFLPMVYERRTGRELVASLSSRIGWPNPLVLSLIVELLVFGPVATLWGGSFAFANALISTPLICGVLYLLRRWIPLPRGAVVRPLALAIWLILIGLVATAVSSSVISNLISPYPPYFGPSALLMLAVGVSLSIWKAVNVDHQKQRRAMMEAVAQEAKEVERIHGEFIRRRAAASEFLHGPIQSQLVASALKGESAEEVLQAVEKKFAEYNQIGAGTWNPKEQVLELIDAWSAVMKIDVDCSDATWNRLNREPLTSRLLVDTLSEAVTNSVRHGIPSDIKIAINSAISEGRQQLRVTVQSKGTLNGGIGSGSGLARLVDRGAELTLDQVGDHVILTAVL